MSDDRRTQHVDADRIEDARHSRAFELLVDHELVLRAEALTAVRHRPSHADETVGMQQRLPRAPGRRAVRRRECSATSDTGSVLPMGVQPLTDLCPVGGELR